MSVALIVVAYLMVGLLTFYWMAKTVGIAYSVAGFCLGASLVLWPVIVVLTALSYGVNALDAAGRWIVDHASRSGVSR